MIPGVIDLKKAKGYLNPESIGRLALHVAHFTRDHVIRDPEGAFGVRNLGIRRRIAHNGISLDLPRV